MYVYLILYVTTASAKEKPINKNIDSVLFSGGGRQVISSED
jgi:hypothetical protein